MIYIHPEILIPPHLSNLLPAALCTLQSAVSNMPDSLSLPDTNAPARRACPSRSTMSLVACPGGLYRMDLPLRGDRHSTLRMGIYLTTSTGISGRCIPRSLPKTKWGAGLCTPQGIFDLSFFLRTVRLWKRAPGYHLFCCHHTKIRKISKHLRIALPVLP